MVQTRSQLENLSRDELIDEVLSLENFKNNINPKFSELNEINTVPSDIANDVLEHGVPSTITTRNISRAGRPESLSLHEKEGLSYHKRSYSFKP